MSHLGLTDPSKGEKTQSYVSKTPHRYCESSIERINAAHPDDLRESVSVKDLDKVKHHREQYHAVPSGSQHLEFQARESMNPATAVSHPAAAASAAAIYSRVAVLPQHSRSSGPSHFDAYGLPHIPPNPPSVSTGHHPPVHSPAYRHLLHPSLLPGQYSNSNNAHIGVDVMWQQKFNPNPWLLAQYEEMRMERERAASHEREREHERIERHKEDRAEKERQREWQEQERLDREERERAQREAVQQHFEESLRLALQKQQKSMGWNPMSGGKNISKARGSSPTINAPHNQSSRSSESERIRDQEKERSQTMENHVRQEHERWLAMVQQQRNEQCANMSHLQNISSVEARSVRNVPKQESSQLTAHGSSKANLAPSPVSSSPSQMKNETNFSLYGYQPFQHTYITHAQLKAREDPKSPANLQPVRGSNSSQIKGVLSKGESERPHTPSSHAGTLINQSSAKLQLKSMLPSQERSGLVYQPLVGSGGAFKPYEYSSNSSSPAPPAHQNTSPAVMGRINPQYQQLDDQPQNLVKSDTKSVQESLNISHKYEPRDSKQIVYTTASHLSASYVAPKNSSPATNLSYSYSLIQQGLVPNPMYIAASHAGNNVNVSKPPAHSGSPPVSQQYTCVSPISGVTSGSSVCRPNSVPFTLPPGRPSRSYSPVSLSNSTSANMNYNKMIASQDVIVSNRAHIQGSSHRSPSPAHLYSSQSNPSTPNSPRQSSPRLTAVSNNSVNLPLNNTMSSSFHSNSLHENVEPMNMSNSGVPLVKRKLLNEDISRKRPKGVEDSLLPPKLQPQLQTSGLESHESAVVTPPHLMSNAPPLAEHSTDGFPAKTNIASPNLTSNLMYKPEVVVTPPPMPDLSASSSTDQDVNMDFGHPVGGAQKYSTAHGKYKIHSQIIVTDSSMEESEIPNVSVEKPNITTESTEEQTAVNSGTTTSILHTVTNASSNNTNHTKLKKAWLQRHSENEDKKTPGESIGEIKAEFPLKVECEEIETDTKPEMPHKDSSSGQDDDIDIKSRMLDETSVEGNESRADSLERTGENFSSSESESELETKSSKKSSQKHSANFPLSKRIKCSVDVASSNQQSPKKEKESKKKIYEKETGVHIKKRGRKSKMRIAEDGSKKAPKQKNVTEEKLPEKPSIYQLRRTNEPFLQDGPCFEIAPRLPKCRECRLTPQQRNKKMPHNFCRFVSYRKLRYGKNGTVLSAGFSEPSDALDEDFKLWIPPIDSPPLEIEIETSKFLLTHVGDQFCDLVEMEKEAQKLHMANDDTITWKRVVQGVREMCDVCETTLFNIHWVCHKCGFVVCIDCYKARKNGRGKDESTFKDRDDYQWLFCNNRQPHEQEKLMLTQIIAGTSLWDLGKTLHEMRRKWNIPTYCSCTIKDCDQDKSSANGICKLMSAVTKCFSSDKDSSSREANGSDSSRFAKRNKFSMNGLVKQEDGLGGYSSESGGSPLNWLADVALTSEKMSDDQRENDDERSSEDQESNFDASIESDDDKSENFSTLRELLIRPTGKMGGKSSNSGSSSQKTLTSTLDEVISCVIEQKVRKSEKTRKEKQLLHFTRRNEMPRSGRELPPIRTCILSESSLLYPEVPHIWLGNGKILLLKEAHHSGNMQMFQEQWKRGQPVIVADVGKLLNPALWNPESFLKEFGDFRIDFLDCMCGQLLPNLPMKKFWEGFENINKRMKGDDGEAVILKMIDWPAGDEFAQILPERYEDLMKALPLPQYTHRNGVLNMASRLPQCFVKPDLGPRLYNAYGISSSLGKGSTNLHLDVSDTINILAYVANGRDGKDDLSSETLKALDDSGCDHLMKKRAKEKNYRPGAIWHVYNARDADKIRDFLNKVSEERGAKQNPHHDPIHNQEWYLDTKLRNRLCKEYGVEAYTIAQCHGDAIFIPAGSPHQVQNLHSCIVVSEDFVSAESVAHCFFLTQEIRNLSDSPLNHEDKLQIKNIIYHAVKDALALLQSHDPEDSKT